MYNAKAFNWKNMSHMRKTYFVKFAWRCFVLIFSIILCFAKPEEFDILKGMNFFGKFSVLHVLWCVWVFDMLLQLIPVKKHVPLGSQKLFGIRYSKTENEYSEDLLKEYIRKENISAAAIFVLWTGLSGAIGVLKVSGIINNGVLFVIVAFFYVCDLFCVLIWCPFRWFMKNRCCTTCRIFNWDHMMMFSPFLFAKGFYGISLAVMAAVIILVWEYKVYKHPERFWIQSNEALKCMNCTDKLCSQYCVK